MHRPMTIVTDDLLWDYTTFTDYAPTTEQSDASADQISDQDMTVRRLD